MWWLITERVLVGWLPLRWQRWVGASVATLIGATAFTVWNQSVVNEKVYTVSLLGIAIIAWLMIRWSDDPDGRTADRILVLVAYIMGLGYSNHMAGMLPALAVAVAVLIRRPRTLLRWKLLLACIGDPRIDVDAPLDTGDFRLVSRPVIDAYRRIQEQQPFVRGLIAWLGFNQIGIRYVRPARAAGATKYPLRKLLRLALDGITSFSDRPLRYAAGIGFFSSFVALLGLVWVVVDKLFFGVPAGWASLFFAALFFGGLQLFFLGVVGAYLARVYEEVKARPRYVLRDVWRSEVRRTKYEGRSEEIELRSSE